MSNQDDLELVQRCLERDPDAVREVGERLGAIPKMVSIVNRRLRRTLSPEAEADTAQEIFVKIWSRLATFEGRSTLEGWAWAFAENHTRNKVRRAVSERYRREDSPEIITHQAMPSEEPPALSRRTAESWLESVSPAMAECIRLKHFDGLLFREIAAKLGVSENTVKARYYRGLRQVREHLSQREGEEPLHD